MPVSPEVQTILDLLPKDSPGLEAFAPAEARALYREMALLTAPPRRDAEQRNIPGPAGEMAVRVYRPGGTPVGTLVWFHGGGFVIGDLDTAERAAASLADASGSVVVSVDYRLAPEHPFPAAAEDCYAALCWVADNAARLGGSADRVAVGGDSAGGNLAAVTALMARDRGGPAVTFQLLVYPVIDAAMDSPSYQANAEGYLLTARTMRWFWQCYLRSPGDVSSPLASPIRAVDLSGLAPALVITAEYDPLRDEGEAYGARLAAAGVPTTVSRYDGQIHGFFAQAEYGTGGPAALAEAAEALAHAFSS
jgi:acetyl esterase